MDPEDGCTEEGFDVSRASDGGISVQASSSIGFFECIQNGVVVIADRWDNFAVAPVHFVHRG